ncbi:hypothetical protein [Streptomyces sp. NBC_01235]|uniref:hypothetical protein n=1 Tax=Streptomyces sp. NBC_01235 TaxID=2903788 RepID=UPI002E1173B1|nr:hypothetical protein OG289_40030 [Streptomyces sp. NBC_01235]
MKSAGTTSAPPEPSDGHARGLSAWRFVLVFGGVSLLMDFVYEGARSVTGPLLAHLGASAAVVGVVLVVLPLLSAAVPALAFTDTVGVVVAGALVWGAAVGVQESTRRATVADLVPVGRRATAYGVFAGIMGAAALVGGALAGVLYDISVPLLIVVVAGIQTAALGLLWVTRAVRSTPVR